MKLYTKTDCPLCTVIKVKLGVAGIPYEICTNEQEMEKLGIDQLPVLVLDNDTQLGFKQILNYIEEDKINHED